MLRKNGGKQLQAIASNRKSSLKKRALSIFLEVSFASILVILGLRYDNMDPKWGGLIIATALAFGYPIYVLQELRHMLRFWLSLSAMLLIHLLIYVEVLSHVVRWPMAAFIVITIFEGLFINIILQRVAQIPKI